MAAGKKKKKPVQSNPARGFATTSIQSKIKVEQHEANTIDEISKDKPSALRAKQEKPTSTSSEPSTTDRPKELHELTPEELEIQLETSELQQFVEQYAAKVRKESVRHASRQQTEKRLLRSQAEALPLKHWLPDEITQQIDDLVSSHPADESATQSKAIFPSGDDLLSKSWQLQICLSDLGFPQSRIDEFLRYLVSRSRLEDSTSPLWGLHDALYWMSLHCTVEELVDYDSTTTSSALPNDGDDGDDHDQHPDVSTANGAASQTGTSTPQAVQDEDVSDVASDLDPNEMVDVYLRTKSRLFAINPDADVSQTKKNASKRGAAVSDKDSSISATERKLNSKLRKLRSDLLFDQQDADMKWSARKVELLREQAERKKLRLEATEERSPANANTTGVQDSNSQAADVLVEAEKLAQLSLAEVDNVSDDGFLGGMFDNLPGVKEEHETGTNGNENGHITIRTFGKITGLNPKRVFEEVCRARDTLAKVSFTMISPTTYSCRHAATVRWSKSQELSLCPDLDGVQISRKKLSTRVSMTSIAAPDVAQSEAFIATVALFALFNESPKEAKASLRLPPAYRDVWDELIKQKQDKTDASDRETVKTLRALVEKSLPERVDDTGTDEVVYNPAMRKLNGTSGSSTPTTTTTTTLAGQPSPDLIDLWNTKISTPAYQQMLQIRSKLPMFAFRTQALDTIARHQVTILCGETGCGKSTQLPAFILEQELSNGRDCKIYCTEPRRISAISLAQRVSEEMGERKGDVGTNRSLVGYAIRLESQTAGSTRLVYATVGIVLRMLESQDGIRDITHLILDEVHERSIDTDFMLIVLRTLLLKRPDLKVVLMSATVDAQRFSSYFDGAPIISVPGRTYPVQALFLEDAIELTGHTVDNVSQADGQDDERDDLDPTDSSSNIGDLSNYSKRTRTTLSNYDEYRIDYVLILKLLETMASDPTYAQYSKAILVFLPGIAEIRQLNDMLGGHPVFSRDWHVFPLHSTFSSEDQQAAFAIPPPGVRKIVIATNIAETGITIPDVTCVIDTGKHKEMRFDERRQMSRLIQSFIARANAKQRRGRAGRVQEGMCFHLFTKDRHDKLMVDQQTPEMLRLSLQDLVMRVKICKLGDIETALSQALDPPSSKNIRRAIDALIEVNALTSAEELTLLGQQLAKLPLDAQLGKLLLLGSIYGCLDVALTVAATLSSKSPFLAPMHAKSQADSVRLGFKRADSDLLTVYNAYVSWRKVCTTAGISEYQFCNKNFLSSQNLANIEDLKAQLLHTMADAGFVTLGPEEKQALSRLRNHPRQRNFIALPQTSTRMDDADDLTNSVIAWAFYPKILRRDGKGWRNIANNQSLGLHQTSVNKKSLSADITTLSFYSIMQTSRFTNAQETSAVSEFALVLLAGEAVFNMYAGVIIIDGNRMKFKVKGWKTMLQLKMLRARLRECQTRLLRYPDRPLGVKLQRWMDVFSSIYQRRQMLAMNLRP